MEEERDRAEFKHVCKLCNKRYPSGKSLGGHMRSHVIANAQKAKAQAALLLKNKAPTFEADYDHHRHDLDHDDDYDEIADKNGSGHSGYGLRENPKKSWRATDHHHHHQSNFKTQNHIHNQNQNQQDQRVCKQCGKAFQSLKALCGHMSSHSERERNFKDDDEEDDHSWSSESHSDDQHHINNINNPESKRQTRSSYSRYKSLTVVDSLSNNSEIDQHEQEEVAICLMMLSRDYSSTCGYKTTTAPAPNCFNFTAESSDNNSVILEGGSSSNHAVVGGGIHAKRKDLYLRNDDNNNTKKKFEQQVGGNIGQKSNVAHEMDNSDSGYFENGAKELDSDDSVGGYFVKNYYYYSSYGSKNNPNPKPEYGSGLVDSSDGSKKRARDRSGFGLDSPESEENSSKKIKQDFYNESSNNNNPEKGAKALGGHIITHNRKMKASVDQSSLDTNNHSPKITCSSSSKQAIMAPSHAKKASAAGGSGGSKKVKGHKCPYCPKVFKSGQALGGHKRSHMMGSGGAGLLATTTSSRAPRRGPEHEPEPEPKPSSPPPALIDLNLPAPVEEEASGNSQFVTW